MDKRKYIRIGKFNLTATTMRISDPCYDKTSQYAGTIENCISGIWNAAYVTSDDKKDLCVSMLIAKHESVRSFHVADGIHIEDDQIYYHNNWHNSGIRIGVDSGQAGIFDDAYYGQSDIFKTPNPNIFNFADEWYNQCCYITMTKLAGTLPCGAISNSGYGDGRYPVFIHKNTFEKIDSIAIVY